VSKRLKIPLSDFNLAPAEVLRQLEAGYRANAAESLKIAEEWFPLEADLPDPV